MSRIGKKPIAVPSGVKVQVDRNSRTVKVEGPKGKLEYRHRPEVDVALADDGQIEVGIPESRIGDRQCRAYWGTDRARIANLVQGVSSGFERKLQVIGVGWNAQAQGKTLRLNVGYCHPVDMVPPAGVEFTVEGPMITISGVDKQAVGQFAANVRSKRPPEPYKGKGIRYVDEYVIRKEGKVTA